MYKHIVVGNLNLDITVVAEKLPAPDESVSSNTVTLSIGGAAVNYSVACARYGHQPILVGVTSSLYKSLGMLDEISARGVNTNYVKIVETGMPGISIILQEKGGQRRIISYRGANELLNISLVEKAITSNSTANIIQFSSTPSHLLEAPIKAGFKGFVAYDPGTQLYRNRILMEDVLGKTDILFLNEAEARRLLPDDPSELLRRFDEDKIIVVKMGERGAEAYTRDKRIFQESIKIRPLDTTGAGDAFNAIFNSSYLETNDIRESLRRAAIAGALKATRMGSAESPWREEIESRLHYLQG